MTDLKPNPAAMPPPSADHDRRPLLPLIGAAILAAMLAGAGAWFGPGLGTLGGAVLSAMAAIVSVGLGLVIGRQWGPFPARIQRLMFRIADELAQYRAFTRLLRDQGDRITETTDDAAHVLCAGLRDMDAKATLVADRIAADMPAPAGEHLRGMALSIADPVVDMLGTLQFQDVTRQQLAFLTRLSLVVDEHMIGLAHQLGDRRSLDRVGEFKQMFDQALDDCVMISQRDDHHAASGLDLREAPGPKIELF